MSGSTNTISQPTTMHKLAGPPTLAKVVAGLFLVFAILTVLSLDVATMALGAVGLLAAVRIFRIGVAIEGDDLVVNNLFYTRRLGLDTSVFHHGLTDLRTREESGIHALPSRTIPVLADDTTQYNAKVLKVTDSSTNETYTLDASFGRTPQGQAEFLQELQTAVSHVQGS